MKKIAIVITNAYSYAGTENVCNYMTEFMGDNNDIDILSLEGEGTTFYKYSKAKQVISFSRHNSPLKEMKKHILNHNYNYVFVVSMGRLSFMLRCHFLLNPSIRKRMRFIACEHIAFDSFSLFIKFIKVLALRWYKNVVVLTDIDQSKLNSYGVNSIKISNPIKYNFFLKNKRSYSALAVGRLSYQKGFDKLLDIWSDFLPNNPDWILNLAGDGELMSELKKKADILNIQHSINFLGKVDNLDELYSYSDCLLMTSRYEGLPMVLLEAKSWSLPVIAYDCPTGPREIIKNNVDGFLVENNNKLAYVEKMNLIANDDSIFFRLSEGTKETYLEFDGDIIKTQWLNLINE